MPKRIDTMSAKELYELAQQKEQEEREQAVEAAKEEVEALRAKRRELNAAYKKDLAAIDRQIRQLASGAPAAPAKRASKKRTGRRGGRQRGVSEQVLSLIRRHGPIALKDLRKKLESGGADTRNLGQTLAYLKSRGVVDTPSRAVYAVV